MSPWKVSSTTENSGKTIGLPNSCLDTKDSFFQSRVGRYRSLTDPEAFTLFVERIEEAISIENSSTLNGMTMANETFDATKHAKPGER